MVVWARSRHPKLIASARLTVVAATSLLIGNLTPYVVILGMVVFKQQPRVMHHYMQPFLLCCLTVLSVGTIRSFWRAQALPASFFLATELLLIWGFSLLGWRWAGLWHAVAGGTLQGVTARHLPKWLPLWCLIGFTSFALIGALSLRWKRLKTGYCIGCGYDLTGLTTTRCPECGQAF